MAAFAATRVFLLFFHVHARTDVKVYWGWMLQAAAGRVPFADFPIEYPPLAWWVMRAPATIDKAAYFFRFRLLMGVADVGSFALLWWIVSTRRPRAAVLVAATYVVTTVVLEFVLYDTLDIVLAALLLGALAAWLRADASARPSAWKAAAYALVGLGTAYKVIPVVVLPFFVLADLRDERQQWRPVAGRLALFFLVLVAPFAISGLVAGRGSFGFLAYHADRGVEIESTAATLMWLVSPRTIHFVERFGSWELEGPLSAAFSVGSMLVSGLYLGAMGGWTLALGTRLDARRAYLQALLTVGGLVLVLKMFSVQYLLWAMPLLVLAAVELLPGLGALSLFLAACIVVSCLTSAFWPFGNFFGMMEDFEQPRTWVMVLLGARNTIYAALFLWLVRLSIASDQASRDSVRESEVQPLQQVFVGAGIDEVSIADDVD